MEFIPKALPAMPAPQAAAVQATLVLDARQRAIREVGVAAVAAALGVAEGLPVAAMADAPLQLPKAA